ncbi:MAG: hypothetical protein WA210_08010 [Burkholderiaceae bacterium]
MKTISIWVRTTTLSAAAAALLACGGGGDSAPAAAGTSTVSGVVASGSPWVGATVSLRCADATTTTGTTDAGGAFSLSFAGRTAPCVLRASGGTLRGATTTSQLHSLATAAGVANLTPLTQLATAQLAGGAASALYDNFNAAAIAKVTDAALTAARTAVVASLVAQGLGDVSALGDFVRAEFQAVASNPHDQALETLAQTMTGRNLTLASVEVALLAGGGGGGAGTVSCNTALFQPGSVREATASDLAARAGTYNGQEYTSEGVPPNLVETVLGQVSMVLASSGSVTYKGAAQTVQSMCVDTGSLYPGLLYLHFASGHLDLFTDGSMSGISPVTTPPAGSLFVLVRGNKS